MIAPADRLPERGRIALEHLALSRRLSCLIEHADRVEAQGGDASPIKGEIERTLKALGTVGQLLGNEGG